MASSPMRFYIDSRNDAFNIRDDEGVELTGIQDARALAARALGGILGDLAAKETNGELVVQVRRNGNLDPVIKATVTFEILMTE